MFWDKAAGFYDLFENAYNGKVNRELSEKVAERIGAKDRVLECACGTGMISKRIAPRCKELIATDFSDGMLKQAKKNCAAFENVKIYRANIMELKCRNEAFDKVVAGNVVHLLEDPAGALKELLRVCKAGGEVIIPTYVNYEKAGKPSLFIQAIEKFGAGFQCQFTYETYQAFFAEMGYENVEFMLVDGKMPCAIAVISKKE